MNPALIGLIGIIIMLILLCARMWIGAALAIVGFLGLAYIKGPDPAFNAAGQAPFLFIAKYDFSTIPMFIFMGCIIAQTGIGAELYYSMNKWFGHLRGGLAIATNWACAALGAITGSSVSGIVVMAKVALPEMRKYKYDDRLSSGVIASASTLGSLIPPSIAFIIYGILTETSIGKLFIAGIIPGLLQAAFYMIAIYLLCLFRPTMGPAGPKTTFKEKVVSLKKTWAAMALFFLVMGGIYFGLFTATEAGAIGSFGAILIAAFSRQLSLKNLMSSLLDTGIITAMVLTVMMGVALFQKFVAVSEIPFALGGIITGLHVPGIIIIIFIIFLYLILGCFLPAIPALMLTTPILFPVVMALGYNPIWYGVLMVRMIEIGGLTPPLGIDCFVLSGISGIPLGTIFRGIIPFVIADVANVALLVAIPALSTFLPDKMM
jgi:C4-dicarboxylate transporter, DctM subunit